MIGKIRRGGGAFDPEGCRAVDVCRADDLVGVVDALKGRWCLITLTINRTGFVGPEAAYQRANEYVRKAIGAACPSGVYAAAFEVQTKTGDGWPHWHVLAWVPDHRTDKAVKAAVERGWRTTTEHIDMETGEVTRSRESIGFVDVQSARDRIGTGIYVSKYLMKRWPAAPHWMLESLRRFRKLRMSGRMYDVLERLHRHDRHRGGRRFPAFTRRRRKRKLVERMASSGTALECFVVQADGRAKFAGVLPLPIPALREATAAGKIRAFALGRYAQCRWEIPPEFVREVRERASEAWAFQRAEEQRRRAELRAQWDEHQERREREEAEVGEHE